jgi:hypothetical protein
LLNGNFSGGKKVGTLHDMRFVFLDNDTKFLFADCLRRRVGSLYRRLRDEDPDEMDIIFSRSKAGRGFTART